MLARRLTWRGAASSLQQKQLLECGDAREGATTRPDHVLSIVAEHPVPCPEKINTETEWCFALITWLRDQQILREVEVSGGGLMRVPRGQTVRASGEVHGQAVRFEISCSEVYEERSLLRSP